MLPPSLSFSSVSTAKIYSVSYCYVCGLTFMRDKKSSLHLGQWWVFIFTDAVAVLLHCSTVDTAGTFQAALVSLSACVVVECKGFKSHAGRVWQNFKWVIMVQIFKQLFGGIIDSVLLLFIYRPIHVYSLKRAVDDWGTDEKAGQCSGHKNSLKTEWNTWMVTLTIVLFAAWKCKCPLEPQSQKVFSVMQMHLNQIISSVFHFCLKTTVKSIPTRFYWNTKAHI